MRCAHYIRLSLRRFPEVAAAALAAIADPAHDGRWTDADSVKEIVWPIVNAINNPTTEQPAVPTQEAQDATQDGDSTEDTQPTRPTKAHRTPRRPSGTTPRRAQERHGRQRHEAAALLQITTTATERKKSE